MGDGIKAWHEDMEREALIESCKRIKTWKPEELVDKLEDIQRDVGWLVKRELRLTIGEHRYLESIYEDVTELLAGKKS